MPRPAGQLSLPPMPRGVIPLPLSVETTFSKSDHVVGILSPFSSKIFLL